MASLGEKNLCYNTSHKSRGKALVINYTENRVGWEKDITEITSVFTKLQFDVQVEHDLDEDILLALLKKVANEDHSDRDCFVMVVMAHGSKEKIHVEGFDVAVDRLWQNFVGDKCPGLKGKPKLFFISLQSGGRYLRNSDKGEIRMDGIPLQDAAPVACNDEISILPMHADLMVMYASYEFAYRNKDDGSWFIQALCKVLSRDIRQTELLSLLTDVSYQVVYKYSQKSDKEGNRGLGQLGVECAKLLRSFNDSEARQDWGWQNKYDLDKLVDMMVRDVTENYIKKAPQ